MVLGFWRPAHAQAPAKGLQIGALQIRGNHSIGSSELRRLMTTRDSPWYDFLPFVAPARFDPRLFKDDVHRIEAYYRDQGFHDVSADSVVDRSVSGRVRLLVLIVEGAATQVSEIHFEGMPDSIDMGADWWSELATQVGRRLIQPNLEGDGRFLVRELQDLGFAFARVEVLQEVNPDAHLAEVQFQMRPGPLCRVGSVRVSGNKRVAAPVVQRGVTLRKGDGYRRRDLLESQRQIYRSGMFRSVILDVPEGAPEASPVDIEVAVSERPPRGVKIGGSFDTEEAFRGSLDWIHRNFGGSARQLKFSGSLSKLNADAIVGLRQPYFLGSRNWLNLSAFVRQERRADFEQQELGSKITFERNLLSDTDLVFNTSAGLVNFEADSAFTELGIALQKDSRDDFFDPGRGVLANLQVRQRGLAFQSNREFLQVTGEGRWYLGLPFRSVMAFRGAGGVILKLGSGVVVPNVERFFAGGMNSVRGWGVNRLGPRDETGEPTGGRSRVEGSVEIRTRVFRYFGTALFLDVGNVASGLDAAVPVDLKWAAGGGVRYLSPIGPVRLDVGVRLSEDPSESGQVQYHLSLGQAF